MTDPVIVGQATAASTQTLVMSVLAVVLVVTVVWQGRAVARGRPRRRERRAAEARAEALMAELLGQPAYAALLERGYLDVPSRVEARIYRVAYPPDGVLVLDHGVVVEHLCVLPEEWVPPADVFLTHKALLEGDEEEYLRVAVHTPLIGDLATMGRT